MLRTWRGPHAPNNGVAGPLRRMPANGRKKRRLVDAFKKVVVARDAPGPRHTEGGVLATGLYDFPPDKDGLEKL